ncbi:NAD(P)H-quinone oxidoreductase [Rhodococcus sp. TAF43]|uniref:NAD(P)H-quinone oxidoreductase n=1 Tax=unclassified Rhodococcus (in: high G+C Gram-positive bacteria) TaxID=192944 RepID=UPI001582497C|nr:NAD(P)H-quinone oxidoreductase [Rhodococcus sp. W8901]QKT10138.1 NAD(P)H-quinone oxidoreductase [Rhodococcus sp. W8901]
MRAVRSRQPGGPETLHVEQLPDPQISDGQLIIDIVGAGLNRADSLQRRGRYNLPDDASDIFGMEISGRVSDVADDVSSFAVGDEVVALLASGGYAEKVAVDARHVLPRPAGVPLLDSAGIPEVAATVVANIFMTGRFQQGQTVLIHGATGGIGFFGIQLVKALGGTVAVTASTSAKLHAAEELGADILINYTTEDFAERMMAHGGADIILDTVAGPYLQRNIEALRPFGRVVTIGMQGGRTGELDFSLLLKKKATVTGTLLRDRSAEQKAEIMAETRRIVWPLFENGQIRTTTDHVFPLSEVAAAHSYFDSKGHLGKVLLDCRS